MRKLPERTLNIVAHEDDDLLFLSPNLLHVIQAGRTVRTVFLTAGDNGAGADYWRDRESGAQVAYAQMCGVANTWLQTDAAIAGHSIPVFTLSGRPSVSLVFMRLPDGNMDGLGFSSTNHKSLKHLWTGLNSTIETIDGLSSYSKATLTNTLTSLMSAFQPDQINTQDYVGTYGDGDHSDHYSGAYFVQAAAQQYTTVHSLTGYQGYSVSFRLANVADADLAAKQKAFYTYTHHDRFNGGVSETFPEPWSMRLRWIVFLLRSRARCLLKPVIHFLFHNGTSPYVDISYAAWLQRQYTVDSRFSGGNPLLIANTGANHMTRHNES